MPRNARPGWTVRDHHFDLADVLRARGYAPRLGGVGIRVVHDGVPVDLIPTVTTSPMAGDHAVFRHRTGTPIATNLSIHCSYVNTWGYRDEIRLLKLWARGQALSVPSFLLELPLVERRAVAGRARWSLRRTRWDDVIR